MIARMPHVLVAAGLAIASLVVVRIRGGGMIAGYNALPPEWKVRVNLPRMKRRQAALLRLAAVPALLMAVLPSLLGTRTVLIDWTLWPLVLLLVFFGVFPAGGGHRHS